MSHYLPFLASNKVSKNEQYYVIYYIKTKILIIIKKNIMPSPGNKQTGSATVKVRNNKRKKVVKVKTKTNDKVSSKSKSVTDKKTGVTTRTTKTKKGNYKINDSAGTVTKATKRKTVQTKVSAEGVMPMLRKLEPGSPMAKKMQAAIRQSVKPAKMAKKK